MNGQVHLYAKCTAVSYYVFNVVFENQIHFEMYKLNPKKNVLTFH